jgi:hypothetical protein
MVIDFELRGWLMRNLSEGYDSKNHSPARRDLIEINFIPLKIAAGAGKLRHLDFGRRQQ